MKKWKLQAYDKHGNRLAVFSPSYEGESFREAFLWFAGRDFVSGNPHVARVEIYEKN